MEGWKDKAKDKGDCAYGPSGWQDGGQSQRGLKWELGLAGPV